MFFFLFLKVYHVILSEVEGSYASFTLRVNGVRFFDFAQNDISTSW